MNTTIKTIADVEQKLGIDFNKVKESLKAIPSEIMTPIDAANMFYQFRWEKIVEAFNNGWRADHLNHSQRKFNPYGYQLRKDDTQPAGFGFSFTDCGNWTSDTDVGERLLLEKYDSALDAIRTFPEEYLAMTLFAKEGL